MGDSLLEGANRAGNASLVGEELALGGGAPPLALRGVGAFDHRAIGEVLEVGCFPYPLSVIIL